MFIKKLLFLIISLLLLIPTAFSAEERGIQSTSSDSQKPPVLGNYYAFIVGINAYKEWDPLKTAVKDATAIKELLINQHSFDKVLLITDDDATQHNVIEGLKKFAAGLNETDNLLIYYAGHGQLDEFTGDGYWIPVDGKHKRAGTWISHLIIKSILSSERVKAKNIALLSDSCYADALLQSGPSPVSTADDKYQSKILALSTRKSRQVFTSGGLEPLTHGGHEGHSLFAYYFLKALKENKRDIIDLENLFCSWVLEPVAEIGGLRPYVGRLKTPMDENGQFVLVSNTARDKNWDQLVDLEYAAISSEQKSKPAGKLDYNPEEPWTGKWDLKYYEKNGILVLEQNGSVVKSTNDSCCKLEGKVKGDYLNGWMESKQRPFRLKMSKDKRSFSGNFKKLMYRISQIWGKRKK
jgi:hypothetical protein